MTSVVGVPLEQFPTRFQQVFVEELKRSYSNLDGEVMKLLGDVARSRMMLGLLQPYLESSDERWDLNTIDQKYAMFVASKAWSIEYTQVKQNVSLYPSTFPSSFVSLRSCSLATSSH